MVPKVGDVVRLNHDFLKVWFKRKNGYFGEEIWKEKFTVTKVKDLYDDEFLICFESKDFDYSLYILSNGESNLSDYNEEYKGVQVFIQANHEINNDIYCSCSGPKKENWVFGERFYVCAVCKKEVI